ncbi:unnamed protein product [Soboliphyme baturini]|uniref:Secreted protein n=1 Tax=Soboliphyme baturini TaxID=241478 RepID=A0A183IVC5_9BILA|nr:unnamed protein product [Soboliphyme baturini]
MSTFVVFTFFIAHLAWFHFTAFAVLPEDAKATSLHSLFKRIVYRGKEDVENLRSQVAERALSMVLGVLATKLLKNFDESRRNTVVQCTDNSTEFQQYSACLRPLFLVKDTGKSSSTRLRRMYREANEGGEFLVHGILQQLKAPNAQLLTSAATILSTVWPVR